MPRPFTILFSTSLSLTFVLLLTGCGPELSDEDLGHVEYRLPEVPGAEKTYELPDLTQIEGQEDPPEEQNLSPPRHEVAH